MGARLVNEPITVCPNCGWVYGRAEYKDVVATSVYAGQCMEEIETYSGKVLPCGCMTDPEQEFDAFWKCDDCGEIYGNSYNEAVACCKAVEEEEEEPATQVLPQLSAIGSEYYEWKYVGKQGAHVKVKSGNKIRFTNGNTYTATAAFSTYYLETPTYYIQEKVK